MRERERERERKRKKEREREREREKAREISGICYQYERIIGDTNQIELTVISYCWILILIRLVNLITESIAH